jgi:hypothetical protein
MIRPDRPSTHFTWPELTTRGGVEGVDLPNLPDLCVPRLVRVAEVLEVLRADVGGPIRVTSGYRHKDGKQHGQGQAADIQVRGFTPLELMRRLHALHTAGKLPHALRQVIAEARPGSNPWLHAAVLGIGQERYGTPHPGGLWWTSQDGENYLPWSPS